MMVGSKRMLLQYANFKFIEINGVRIKIVSELRNLGVMFDRNLSMRNQVDNLVKTCNYQLRNIAFIRRYLDKCSLQILVHYYVLSRLDYCNSIYYNLPSFLLKKLQNIMNRAARLIAGLSPRDRITPTLIDLHWHLITARIN